jgi:hypothetical protein
MSVTPESAVRAEHTCHIPKWNPEDRDLFWRGQLIRHFDKAAAAQCELLSAFEAAGWPRFLRNPMSNGQAKDPTARLQATVKNLHRGLPPGTLVFHMDGTGERVGWKAVG